MNKLKLRASAATTALVISMVTVGISSPIAGASSDYSQAVYQITWSLNCNNPSASCANTTNSAAFGLGGQWGWAALSGTSTGGTANVQVTDCGHLVGSGGPGLAGAVHISLDTTWFVMHGKLYIGGGLGIPPVPATYGHYSTSITNGPNAGAFGEITVAP